MIYLQLYWEFFKIGLFAVGGGQATIPFLTKLAKSSGWYTVERLVDMIAVSESTPGPIGVNMATYVGYTIKGIPGSLIATLGLITPCVVIILIIAKFLQAFRHNKTVESVFYGIRPASTGLIGAALITLCRLCLFNENLYRLTGNFVDLFNIKYLILFAALMVFANIKKFKKLHPIVMVAAAAVIGIIFKF